MKRTALIIGASRGIGLGLVQRLLEREWEVIATVRDRQTADLPTSLASVQIEIFDIKNDEQLEALYQHLNNITLDLLFINAGIFGPNQKHPGAFNTEEVGTLFMTNTIAPIRIAERFFKNLRNDTGIIAFMSSRLATIEKPDSPRSATYKASKAALNYLIMNFAAHLTDSKITILGFYPGWVKTDMGGDLAYIDIQTSTQGLIEQALLFMGRGGVHFIDYLGNNMAK